MVGQEKSMADPPVEMHKWRMKVEVANLCIHSMEGCIYLGGWSMVSSPMERRIPNIDGDMHAMIYLCMKWHRHVDQVGRHSMHATWRRRIQNFPSFPDGDDQFPEVDDGTKRLFWARSTPKDEARVADKELGVASTAVTAPRMLLVRPIADSAGTHRCLTSTQLRQGSQVGIRLSRINVSFLIWTRDMLSEIGILEQVD